MFAGWTVKREAGRQKPSCQPSEATTAWQCWGASSSLPAAARPGTTAETLPVTCCTDTTPATTSGPGYCTKQPVPFFSSNTFQFTNEVSITYTEHIYLNVHHNSRTNKSASTFSEGGDLRRYQSKRKLPLFVTRLFLTSCLLFLSWSS